MSYPRNGPASRAVALDLMLRTFMNSADFHASNPKIWENIARLVPGTTPQQCAQRWEELRLSHSAVAGDFSGLTATGRPISSQGRRQMSKFVRSMFNQHPRSSLSHTQIDSPVNSSGGGGGGYHPDSRPHSVMSSVGFERPSSSAAFNSTTSTGNGERGGKFVANFCQTVFSGSGTGVSKGGDVGDDDKETEVREGESGSNTSILDTGSGESSHNTSVGEYGPNMIIHVCDEAKKLKRNFTCPRDVLIREMSYFDEYLSSDTQLWDEVDISVHCDVPVFDWLMRYAKRGMLEGPCGEKLSSPLVPPSLEPSNAVSILISSDFLKMNTLVEECLNFCHDNISLVVSSPSNMGCINDKLLARLAAKFTPLEIERIVDKKDKIKSKLFLYQIEKLFDKSHSTPECPASAATLYKCKYCNKLLTTQLETLLPCTPQRITVSRTGKVVYNHEHDSSWNINHHLQSMQQREGLTPCDIYWRLWGVINWLQCARCHSVFQCCDLSSCAYHPRPATVTSMESQAKPVYSCCKTPANGFSFMAHTQDGCCHRDHVVDRATNTEHSSQVYSTLLRLRGIVCSTEKQDIRNTGNHLNNSLLQPSTELCILQNEERKPACVSSSSTAQAEMVTHSQSVSKELSRPHSGVSGIQKSASVNVATRQPYYQQGIARQPSHDYSELHEDEEDMDNHPLPVQPSRQRRFRNMYTRQRPAKNDLHRPSTPVDWVWDSTKPKRLNQDMQRESDERRLAQMTSKFLQMTATSNSGTTTTTASVRNKDGAMTYAGGIFSRLEAQFRAQQAAKALALQNTQTRSQGSGRKR